MRLSLKLFVLLAALMFSAGTSNGSPDITQSAKKLISDVQTILAGPPMADTRMVNVVIRSARYLYNTDRGRTETVVVIGDWDGGNSLEISDKLARAGLQLSKGKLKTLIEETADTLKLHWEFTKTLKKLVERAQEFYINVRDPTQTLVEINGYDGKNALEISCQLAQARDQLPHEGLKNIIDSVIRILDGEWILARDMLSKAKEVYPDHPQ